MNPNPRAYLPHEQRVVEEREQLVERCEKLLAFLQGPVFPTLPLAEQDRLHAQLSAMSVYRFILTERILNF